MNETELICISPPPVKHLSLITYDEYMATYSYHILVCTN